MENISCSDSRTDHNAVLYFVFFCCVDAWLLLCWWMDGHVDTERRPSRSPHIFFILFCELFIFSVFVFLFFFFRKVFARRNDYRLTFLSLVYFLSSLFRVEDLATKANRADGWTKSANGTLCRHTFVPSLQCLWKTQRYYPADFYWRTASDVIRWRNWRDRLGRSVGCRSATGRCALTCFLANHHCGSLPTLYCI